MATSNKASEEKPGAAVKLTVTLGQVVHDGKTYAVGDSVSLPTKDAERLLALGVAKKA